MGDASSGLLKLRPVSFRYKKDLDPSGLKQYGLVAEEVAKLYPDLVIRDTAGKVQSIRYLMLTSMLLNELQKQTRENARQTQQIKKLSAEAAKDKAERTSFEQKLSTKVAEEQAERVSFEQRLSTLERTLAARDQNQTLAAAGR